MTHKTPFKREFFSVRTKSKDEKRSLENQNGRKKPETGLGFLKNRPMRRKPKVNLETIRINHITFPKQESTYQLFITKKKMPPSSGYSLCYHESPF